MNKKALWIVTIVLVLAVAVVFAACETNIEDGKIDVDEEILAKIPATVDVKGLEGVTGTAKVDYVDATTEAAAITAIKAADYYIPEGATTYAVDIEIVDADGNEITVGKPVTVSIELKAAVLPLDQYVVFHVHDGVATLIEPTVDGNKLTFSVSTFSTFIVVPKHVHAYGEWKTQSEATCQSKKVEVRECTCGDVETREVGELGEHSYGEWRVYSQPDCVNVGVEMRECACGAKETREFGEILGHVDENKDNVCDRCGASLHEHKYGEWTVYSPATCTEAAVERRLCACGAMETRTVGESLGHSTEHIDAVPETCTEDGNIEYFYCSRCEKYFLEAECFTEITLAQTVAKAPGHADGNEDGKCDACGADMGEEQEEEVPLTVEAAGAEGSIVNVIAQNVSKEQQAAAIQKAKAAYYFEDDAEFVVVDLSTDSQLGIGSVVSVKVKLKDAKLALDQYIVLHIHNDEVEEIEPTVDGESLILRVTSFSPFVFGPKHMHVPGKAVVNEATCTADGQSQVECVKCHKVLSTEVIPAQGHVDKNEDGTCDVCGESVKEEPAETYPLAGKVFTYDHAEGEGINVATYAEAYGQATFSFFADNYMEYHEFGAVAGGIIRANNVVLCGTYAVTEDKNVVTITLTVTKRYYDDEETAIPFPTYTYTYDVEAAAVVLQADDGMGHLVSVYFTEDTEATPTQYTAPAPADNWDDSVISAAFNALGADKIYTFPKLDNVLAMSKSDVEMGQVTVTIKMSSKKDGATAATNYKGLLEFLYYDYTWTNAQGELETRVNTDDNLFWFIMATGYVDGYPALTIKISRFAPAYPDAGIVNFLADNDMTDEIPLFTTPWAMDYRFDTKGTDSALAYIVVTLRYVDGEERYDSEVKEAFVNLLKSDDYGYQEQTIGGKTYLCSPNNQILLRVVTGKVGNTVVVYINDDSIIYPAEAIAAYLEGTEDTFIDLADDAVVGYELYTNEADNPTALRLVGKMPSSADAHKIVEAFEAAFADAGYKWGGFATHLGGEEDLTLYHHAWISANQEIAISFAAFNYGEHDFGTIAYYSISIVNLTDIADNRKALMTALSAAGHAETVQKGDTYTFTGGIAYLYTNVGTGAVSGGMYTNDLSMVEVGTLDTSKPGMQTLRISLKGNAEIYTDVNVMVLALTSITAETTKYKIDGRVVYYSTQWKYEKDYTITKHYSDGATLTMKGNADGVVFSDIDGALAKQDLTISYTENGETVSTTVPIALFRAVNFTCTNDWDIGVDDAQFAIYAQGGSYGDGAWVALSNVMVERKTFAGNLYVDAEGFYFVRLSPSLNVFGEEVYDLESEGVWNVSAYIAFDEMGVGDNQFAFLG